MAAVSAVALLILRWSLGFVHLCETGWRVLLVGTCSNSSDMGDEVLLVGGVRGLGVGECWDALQFSCVLDSPDSEPSSEAQDLFLFLDPSPRLCTDWELVSDGLGVLPLVPCSEP